MAHSSSASQRLVRLWRSQDSRGMYYVYILQSTQKNWKYIGCTGNIESRLALHNYGATKSTKAYRPLKLIYKEEYHTITEARKRENFLKKNFKAREEIYKKLGIL